MASLRTELQNERNKLHTEMKENDAIRIDNAVEIESLSRKNSHLQQQLDTMDIDNTVEIECLSEQNERLQQQLNTIQIDKAVEIEKLSEENSRLQQQLSKLQSELQSELARRTQPNTPPRSDDTEDLQVMGAAPAQIPDVDLPDYRTDSEWRAPRPKASTESGSKARTTGRARDRNKPSATLGSTGIGKRAAANKPSATLGSTGIRKRTAASKSESKKQASKLLELATSQRWQESLYDDLQHATPEEIEDGRTYAPDPITKFEKIEYVYNTGQIKHLIERRQDWIGEFWLSDDESKTIWLQQRGNSHVFKVEVTATDRKPGAPKRILPDPATDSFDGTDDDYMTLCVFAQLPEVQLEAAKSCLSTAELKAFQKKFDALLVHIGRCDDPREKREYRKHYESAVLWLRDLKQFKAACLAFAHGVETTKPNVCPWPPCFMDLEVRRKTALTHDDEPKSDPLSRKEENALSDGFRTALVETDYMEILRRHMKGSNGRPGPITKGPIDC